MLAVKPQDIEALLTSISEYVEPIRVVLSVVAAISVGFIEKRLGEKVPVVRAMPNALRSYTRAWRGSQAARTPARRTW